MLGSLKRYGQLLTAKTQASPPYKPEWLPGILNERLALCKYIIT